MSSVSDQLKIVTTNRNRGTALNVVFIIIGMFGLAYASVPLYDLFCRVTGFGGTTQTATVAPEFVVDRAMTVRFNADTARGLPWDFRPEVNKIDVKVGESTLAFFYAINTSDKPITGTSIYNVTPLKMGPYFNKVECFCFEEQVIQPGEKIRFPVSFFIYPAIMEDNDLEDVATVTLSYTFFEVPDAG